MADSNMSIPVRTQNTGDVKVQIADATAVSNLLKVLADGSINVNIVSGSAGGGASPGDSGLVYDYIVAGQAIFIPATMQMQVVEQLVVDGELLIDGTLILES